MKICHSTHMNIQKNVSSNEEYTFLLENSCFAKKDTKQNAKKLL